MNSWSPLARQCLQACQSSETVAGIFPGNKKSDLVKENLHHVQMVLPLLGANCHADRWETSMERKIGTEKLKARSSKRELLSPGKQLMQM